MKIIFSFFIFLFSLTSFATGPGLTYHGRLLDPASVPVTASNVEFKIQIRSFGVEDCLMYEETQTLDMSNSDGVFSLSVNDGTGVRTDTSGLSMKQILSNRNSKVFAAGKCTNGALSWTPAATDGRKISILFNDGTFANGTWETIPAITVNFVPMAIEAQQVDGYSSNQILKIADGVSTTGTELSSTNWGKLTDLINGTSTQYLTPGAATFSSAPTWAGTPSAASDLVNKNYVDSEIASSNSASGTVTAGTANQLAYYSANGNSLVGLSTSNNGVLVTSGGGIPSIASTLPTAVQSNITTLGTIGSGLWNGTAIGAQFGGTGINSADAGNGQLLIGNGTGFSLANLSQSANQGVSITNSAGGIALGTVQDLRSTASPNFSGLKLNNATTELTQSVSMGTSYSMVWPGNVAAANGSVLTSTTAGLLSWQAPADISTSLSKISSAAATNTIDNADFSQIWNWSTATTQTSLSMSGDSLTTGSLLSLSTSNNSVNSTQGLLIVKNSGNSTTGTLARFQSNSDSD